MTAFKWVGSEKNYVDEPFIQRIQHVTVGLFGGNSASGSYKNEDGCLVWINDDEDWEFVMILDAHYSAQSAELVLDAFEQKQSIIEEYLAQPIRNGFNRELEQLMLGIFQEESFLHACRNIQGETACLITVRKDQYVWWLSIGDCLLYCFHPELAALGQYQLNQRQFYEWVGRVNTFEQAVPCYSTGTRELRKGRNHLFLTTDGLVECPGYPFSEPEKIIDVFAEHSGDSAVFFLLKEIQKNHVRDSTTIVSWDVNIEKEASMPSDL
ncbi:protein phosphatase 2C domain-containing protein [Heyndrickxia vini]|uniref:Protein phosphatase 2C domain-containing protein n=1 Tax=Heyndrickxia vini TaxID=1476025 RepID=A0ABX7E2N7_9BACI|nr:protein phosphatase 2C domain-containing protein [Heyndrickxia vini]QQZ09991.1 protein phosphatase 2C domain-containing protein [Heyndrickxia vini]